MFGLQSRQAAVSGQASGDTVVNPVHLAQVATFMTGCGALAVFFGLCLNKSLLISQMGTLPFWLMIVSLLTLGLGGGITCPYLLGWSEHPSVSALLKAWLPPLGYLLLAFYAYVGLVLLVHPGHYGYLFGAVAGVSLMAPGLMCWWHYLGHSQL